MPSNKTKDKDTPRPSAPTAPAAMANDPKPQSKAEIALSKDIYYFARKSEAVHSAIKEVWAGIPFLDVAKKYNKSPEEMAVAFAVFGKQAIDISREKGVVSPSLPQPNFPSFPLLTFPSLRAMTDAV